MEKLIYVILSQETHTARSNPALCLALFLSSSTLLTATIFYLDQAETRKKTVPEAFFFAPKPDPRKSVPSTLGFFQISSTSDSSCS